MINKYVTWAAAAALGLGCGQAFAADLSVSPNNNVEMKVSIYNQNLAFVKDTRGLELPDGVSSLAFEGIARQMKPETALLQADGVQIYEQNYEYDLLTPENIIKESVGKNVKAVRVNPANGELIVEEAKVINSVYNKPLLETKNGVFTEFPGWISVDKVPANLRLEPTLIVKLNNQQAAQKNVTLNYLTEGMSWAANYVAEISGEDTLDLQGWVTLNNNSGADFKNAEVQLISGEVNNTNNNIRQMPRNFMMKSAGLSMEAMAADTANIPAENLAEYYIYKLPLKTDIMDQSSKQISLLNKPGVTYSKLYRLVSPLYLTWGNNRAEFEKMRPSLIYKLVNDEASKLGEPLPAGIVRFYEKDQSGALQFTGSAPMPQLAKGEKAELAVGQAFDIYAKGVVKNMQKLSEKMIEAEVEVTFHNAKNLPETVEYEQSFSGSPEVVSESEPSVKEKARSLKWNIEIPAGGEKVLTYKVRVVQI